MKLFYFDELLEVAQKEALRNVFLPEITAHEERIESAKLFLTFVKIERLKRRQGLPYKRDLIKQFNQMINDRYHIKRIINGAQALYKWRKQGNAYAVPYVRSNRTIFTVDGGYVTYVGEFSIVRGFSYYAPTSEEIAVMRDAYIAVNQRGPGYHDELFRRLNKIKKTA